MHDEWSAGSLCTMAAINRVFYLSTHVVPLNPGGGAPQSEAGVEMIPKTGESC